ncbi:hypothetical protein VXQ18_17185 [Brucella abortus]|nr:hypothetical protein [Brucella abortus]
MNGLGHAATTGKFRYQVARGARAGEGCALRPLGHRVLPQRLGPMRSLPRWDRPIGWQLLLWPCWWSTALVAGAGEGWRRRMVRAAVFLASFPVPRRRIAMRARRLHL